ncbi:MAG: tol-pal system YbgF family protein [Fidelibacterota bacterium]
MKQFIFILSIFCLMLISCEGRKTAEEYFTQSELDRNSKNIKSSLENLENVITHYPDHSLASKAQYLIGDIYMNDLRDFEAAVSAYNSVLERYQTSEDSPKAQFMIGYIYANPQFGKIQNLEKARSTYEQFLENFPNHELAPSVQFEMENLGKDINDIPILKHISS